MPEIKPEIGTNDGWWWIVDDPTLSVHEKMAAMAIYRKQFRGNAVVLKRAVICELASISRRQLVRCEESLKARGMLAVVPTKHPHVFVYRVRRVQFELFERGGAAQVPGSLGESDVKAGSLGIEKVDWSSAGLNPASVENAVDNNGITAYRGGSANRDLGHRPREPENLGSQAHIETELLTNSKDKTRAEVRPRAAHFPDDEGKKRRNIEARNQRLQEEIDQLRESSVGLDHEIYADKWQTYRDAIGRCAQAMQPMTQREFDERRRLLARQAEGLLKKGNVYR